VADVATGSVSIPFGATVDILRGAGAEEAVWERIILDLRLPQAGTAVFAGAALAVSGLVMQTLFRNPLADPFVLGISSGASLGVALVVLGGGLSAGAGAIVGGGVASAMAGVSHVAAAIGGAVLMLLLVVFVARRVSTLTLLLLGVLAGYAASALVSILLRFAAPANVQTYVIWTLGEFAGVSWSEAVILAPALGVGLVMAAVAVKPLNALLLGETYARSMGVAVERSRIWLIASTAVLAGAVTAFCGPIGFLGIAVPHLARGLLQTSDHRLLVPGTALLGAALALLADLLTQVPGGPRTLPLNAVTALLGAPVVVWVILARRSLRDAPAAG
ncbi:MAG TPA: iron ABC transporter permease, partial [Thermoanaerobaculia bacterium]|nr:iron ABC transporter permease [Thermoanaerobaculia bacterium]